MQRQAGDEGDLPVLCLAPDTQPLDMLRLSAVQARCLNARVLYGAFVEALAHRKVSRGSTGWKARRVRLAL